MAKLWRARHALALAFLVAVSVATPATQTRPVPAQRNSVYDAALFSLNTGKYDDVDRLLRDEKDTRAFALRARALIARGHYQDAEKLLTPVATAQPGSDAALELGLLDMYLGRDEAGGRLLRTITAEAPSNVDGLIRVARADRALGSYRDAVDALQAALRTDKDNVEATTLLGELYQEKFDSAEATKRFRAALTIQQNYVPALIGTARVALDEDPSAASTIADQVLTINPNSTDALLLEADMALDERRRDEALDLIRKAQSINPSSLEAYALSAAHAAVTDDAGAFDAAVQKALQLNPKYGDVYRVASEHLAHDYRFDKAEDLARRAVQMNPDNARSLAALGLDLLRVGDEPGARRSLERAFKIDDFDVVTYNLLQMLDKLDTFTTVKDGDVVIRLDKDEASVMREQVPAFATRALTKLEELWDFKPQGPILIEMFPVHDDFAVRNLGLPGMIGALGACFGKVVTLDSPHARPPGEYNWQPTLWHELAHVITLQMSNNRVPRWLTEGISVWEERRAAPEWGREMEVSFAHALDQDKILKLKVLNDGFSDPKMISLAYYEASLVAEHLVETYGMDKMRALLRAYGRGLETEEAVKEVYGVTLDDIQTSFDASLAKHYGPLRAALKTPKLQSEPGPDDVKKLADQNPGSFPVQMLLGETLYKMGDKAGAIKAYERAAKLVPLANGDDNPNRKIAQIALEQKDTPRAIEALEAVIRVDHDDVESARKLASLLAPLGDAAKTEDAYRRLVGVDPFDAQAETALGRLELQRKETGDAIVSFRTALGANPPDKAAAHLDLAQAYLAAGRQDDAKKEALAALEIAPAYEPAQDLLLKIVGPQGGA